MSPASRPRSVARNGRRACAARCSKAVVGQDARHRARAGGAARRRPRADRGHAGSRQDAAGQEPRHGDGPRVRARPVHARPAAQRRRRHDGLPAAARRVHAPTSARSSPTWCSPTRSTARRPRCRARCSRRCRSARSPSAASRIALPRPFLVMATQNPVEQEGTYPLPEAQTDRFLFKLHRRLPGRARGARHARALGPDHAAAARCAPVSSAAELLALRAGVDEVYVSEELQRYVLALVRATRDLAAGRGAAMNGGPPPLAFGASPRATLALVQAARALAFVRGQDYVTPALVQELVLRRRAPPRRPHLRGRGRADHARRRSCAASSRPLRSRRAPDERIPTAPPTARRRGAGESPRLLPPSAHPPPPSALRASADRRLRRRGTRLTCTRT